MSEAHNRGDLIPNVLNIKIHTLTGIYREMSKYLSALNLTIRYDLFN